MIWQRKNERAVARQVRLQGASGTFFFFFFYFLRSLWNNAIINDQPYMSEEKIYNIICGRK